MPEIEIVQLVSKRDYDLKIDRTRWLYLAPLEPRITGIGWPGYREQEPVKRNLKRLFGGLPDIVDIYQPEHYIGVADLPCLTTVQTNEIKPSRWKPRIAGSRPDVVVFRHYNDYLDWADVVAAWGLKPVHIPHVADPAIFYPRDVPTQWDFLTVGAWGGAIYPVRGALHRAGLLLAERGWRYTRLFHPGNEVRGAAGCAHLDHFADVISSSWLVGTCSSKYRYRLGKYVEIPACGSALVADRPVSRERMDFFVDIGHDPDPEEVADLLEGMLESGEDAEYAGRGLEYAREFDVDYYVREYLRVCERS